MKFNNNMTMKMKLNPEISCLETQEKFWRGRLKEISDKYAEEKQNMQQLLHQITAENEQLKNELDDLRIESQKYSVAVQTSLITAPTYTCIRCGKLEITPYDQSHENSVEDFQIAGQKNISDYDSVGPSQQEDHPFITETIISNDNEQEQCLNEVEKTITKLFRSDGHSNSHKIADKLIELYEKRSNLIPEIENDEIKNVPASSSISMAEKYDNIQIDTSDDKPDENYIVSNEVEEDPNLTESTSNIDDYVVKNAKTKHKIVLSVHNIRKKVIKKISRIKRTCVDLKANNVKLKSCMGASNENVMSSENQRLDDEISTSHAMENHSPEETTSEKISFPSKCQLISAMKKSKSTGNIVKKVAFLDDLPTSKTVSESNLLEIEDYRLAQVLTVNSYLVDSASVHRGKISKPIPAPRSKKNIISNS